MRLSRPLGLAILAAAALAALPAQAQYDEGYDRPPPRRIYRERPEPVRASGLNCDAVQYGISGAQPYSCPLPGPRPLGARCYCETPVVSFSSPQTVVGRVVP